MLVLKDGFLYSVNIGDSRAVLAVAPEEGRSKFVSVQLTTDHVCQDVHERERIERNGGWVQEGRLNGDLDMSRTIGDHEFKKYRNQKQFNAAPRQFGQHLLIATPDVSVRRVLQRDAFVVLATDGVWSDCVSNELVVKTAEIFLNGGKHPAQAAMGVATLALNLGSEDNVSVVVVALRPIEPQERARRRDRIRARMGNGASSGNTNRVTSRPFFRRKPISPEDDRTVHNEHRFVEFKQHESESNDSVTPGEVDTSTS